jgi:hypothetical protein
LIANNLRLVRKAWDKKTAKIDVATRVARDEMMLALIQLAKEQIQGRRPKVNGRYTKATPGLPPMNRTGDLRRSIMGEKFRAGFASYSAIVGPTIIYGRRVELGGGNWKAGVRFPYMEPAYAMYRSAVHKQIVDKYFRSIR